MNLLDIAQNQAAESGKIASNAVFYLQQDQDEQLKIRLHQPLCHDADILDTFRHLDRETETLTHPRFLKLDHYTEDLDGGYWTVQETGIHSLADTLRKEPGLIANEGWKEQFIGQMLDCIDFLHRRNLWAVEISFNSLLVTDKDAHDLKMLPPCSSFVPFKGKIWTETKEYLAPEVTNPMEVDRRADIFGIGYMLKNLHPFGDIPLKYRKTALHASNERIEKRFETIGELTRFMEEQKKHGAMRSTLGAILFALCILGLFIWSFSGDDSAKDSGHDKQNTKALASDSTEEKSLMDEVERYLSDSTSLSADTTYSLSEAKKAEQKALMEKATLVFEQKFRAQALPIIRKIYDPELMKADEAQYAEQTRKLSKELQDLKDRLATQYQIDPTTATRISGEVTRELANSFSSQ